MKNNYLVIMAGGVGMRFWPISNSTKPKQFLDILGTGKTMLQMTFERFKENIPKENIFVITLKNYVNLVAEQLPEISANQILSEPERKNTATCIAYASFKILKKSPQAIITVTPSDHLIIRENELTNAWLLAYKEAKKNHLVTFGITPHKPATGFGYIDYSTESTEKIRKIKKMTEKPTKEKAEQFLESGHYLWNSGIFVWSVQTILNSFRTHLPKTYTLFEQSFSHLDTKLEEEKINEVYAKCENISIDYGILEHSDNIYVVISNFGWSDLGSWESLFEISTKDKLNNFSSGNVFLSDTKNSIIYSENEKLIVVKGIDNGIIVNTDNVTLISNNKNEKEFKELILEIISTKGMSYS